MAEKAAAQGPTSAGLDAKSTQARVQEMIQNAVSDPVEGQSAPQTETAAVVEDAPQAQDAGTVTGDTPSTPPKTADDIDPPAADPAPQPSSDWTAADSRIGQLVAQLEASRGQTAEAEAERDQRAEDHREATRWGTKNRQEAKELTQRLDTAETDRESLSRELEQTKALLAEKMRQPAAPTAQDDPYGYADPYANEEPAPTQPASVEDDPRYRAQQEKIAGLESTVESLAADRKKREFDTKVATLTAEFKERKAMLMGPQYAMSENEANVAIRAHADGNNDAFTDLCIHATRRAMASKANGRPEAAASNADLQVESEGANSRSTSAPRRPPILPADMPAFDMAAISKLSEPQQSDARVANMAKTIFAD
jgi:hypothetical protein